METAAKRARAGGGSAPDRLSALSDELLHCVLSFLPSQQAVQTTVLSKRWIDLWRSMPAINLDISEFRSTTPFLSLSGYYKERWGKMENFTTNLLLRHRAPRLDAFRLDIGFTGEFDWSRDVDRWIRRAIEYCPVVLEIRLMVGCDVRCQLPKLASCHLKRLVIRGVYLEHSFTEQLHSGCPVLEDLVLSLCREFCGLQSDTLKNLVICSCSCSSQVADILVIRAPSLVSLCLDLPSFYKHIVLDTGKLLVKASISLPPGQISQRGQTILLGNLVNVTSLELSGFDAMAILAKEFDNQVFDNLRTLSLHQRFMSIHDVDKFKALVRLLQRSPNLENLTLRNFQYDEDTERTVQRGNRTIVIKTVSPVVGPIEFPMLENLTTLLLVDCDLYDNFRLLRHFLRSSPNLEKLPVQLCELPIVLPGGKGKAKSKKTYCQIQSLVRFKCQKLKSTEIIYENGSQIQGLVSLFLGISRYAPKNTITLTQFEL